MPGFHPAVASGKQQDTGGGFLFWLTALLAITGLAISTWPLIDSMNPSGDALNPVVSVDLDAIPPGQRKTVYWRDSIPVFVVHRTAKQIARVRADDDAEMPFPELDRDRVQRDEWLVVIAQCQLGFDPYRQIPGRWGGWRCPFDDEYDLSGRLRNRWGEKNFIVPPYYFQDDRWLVIGDHP